MSNANVVYYGINGFFSIITRPRVRSGADGSIVERNSDMIVEVFVEDVMMRTVFDPGWTY